MVSAVSESLVSQPRLAPKSANAGQPTRQATGPRAAEVALSDSGKEKQLLAPTLPMPFVMILPPAQQKADQIAKPEMNKTDPPVAFSPLESAALVTPIAATGVSSIASAIPEATLGTRIIPLGVHPEVKTLPPISQATLPTAPDAEPTTGPIIQVRIGRIDVRAVLTPEQAKPARSTAKPKTGLSLDEYLKSRNEGER